MNEGSKAKRERVRREKWKRVRRREQWLGVRKGRENKSVSEKPTSYA